MAVLSPAQIEAAAYQAGFRGDALRWITAIALAESGGNTSAYNPESAAGTAPGRGSVGLTQIYLTAHPEFNQGSLQDPVYNLKAAYKVYAEAGNRFTPWSTYNQGIASRYLAQVPSLNAADRSNVTTTLTSMASGSISNQIPGSYLTAMGVPQTTGVAVGIPGPTTQAGGMPNLLGIDFSQGILKGLGIDPISAAFTLGGGILVIMGIVLFFYVSVKAAAPIAAPIAKTAATVAAL